MKRRFRNYVYGTVMVLLAVLGLNIVAVASGGPSRSDDVDVSTTQGYNLTYNFDSTYHALTSEGQVGTKNAGATVIFDASLNKFTFTAQSSSYEWGVQAFGYNGNKYSRNVSTEANLKNTSNKTLNIIYTYSVENGSVVGSELDVGAEKTFTWLPNQTISFYLITTVKDTKASSSTATATFTIHSCSEVSNYDVAIYPTRFGEYTYTVGEKTATLSPDDSTYTTSETNGATVTCSVPNLLTEYSSDYYFYGWSVNGTVVESSNAYSGTISTHTSILPVFLKNGTANNGGPFSVNGSRYLFWKEAFQAAGKTYPVVIAEDYTLPTTLEENGLSKADGVYLTGSNDSLTYVVPTGTVLLVPFDAEGTCYTDTPTVVFEDHVTPSAYRTLTLPDGVTISVNGKLSVSSKLSAKGQNSGSWNATPTGKHGRIDMEEGSAIVLNDGGKLYAYGYVAGEGAVTAKAGSTVYECFQLRSWRGGTATSSMVLDKSKKIFPMNQYYIQNVEVPLTFEYGSSEIVWTATNMNSKASTASSTFIGSGGFFVPKSGCEITKRYDGASDRLIFDIDGDTELSSFSVTVAVPIINSLEINTADYVMPVTNNMTVNINSGTTQIKQTIGVLPGVVVNVGKDAYVDVLSGYKVYIYDQDEWGAYAYTGGTLNCVGYSTVNGTTTKRTADDLVDAKLNINGTFEVNGQLYTTESGGDIVSTEGTGKLVFTSGKGSETSTYQTTENNSAAVSINITSAQLHNGTHSNPNKYDGKTTEYTTTDDVAAGDFYTYCMSCDMWVKGANGLAHIMKIGEVVGHAATLDEAKTDYGSPEEGEYIQMLANSENETVVFANGTYLDLNGYSITGTGVSVDGTLYGMDKTTDGYGEAKGRITVSNGTVAAAAAHPGYAGEVYAAYTNPNSGATTFNRVSFPVTGYYLEAVKTGASEGFLSVGFEGEFHGNDDAIKALAQIGFVITDATKPEDTKPEDVTTPTPGDLAENRFVRYTMKSTNPGATYTVQGLMEFANGSEVEEAVGKTPQTLNIQDALKAYRDQSTTTEEARAILAFFIRT